MENLQIILLFKIYKLFTNYLIIIIYKLFCCLKMSTIFAHRLCHIEFILRLITNFQRMFHEERTEKYSELGTDASKYILIQIE